MRMTVLSPGPLTGNPLTGLEWKDVLLPPEPTLTQLKLLIEPTLPHFERVAVLYQGHAADMFVDEHGHKNNLERNDAATLIYWTNKQVREMCNADHSLRGLTMEELCRRAIDAAVEVLNTDDAPYIAGPAVLFEKQVWF